LIAAGPWPSASSGVAEQRTPEYICGPVKAASRRKPRQRGEIVADHQRWKDAVSCVLGSLVAVVTMVAGAQQLFVVGNRGYGVLLVVTAVAVSGAMLRWALNKLQELSP
jgi:hypothetical protein